MKMRVAILVTSLFAISITAKPVLNIQQWTTTQGSKVYFVKTDQTPMLDIGVVFNAGSAYDNKAYGLASLTSNMLSEGAGKWSVDQIADRFNDVGSQFNHSATQQIAGFYLRTLTKPSILTQSLKTFTTVLTQPTFPAQNAERLKKQMAVGIQSAEQNPAFIANRVFDNAIWSSHAYANAAKTNVQTVSKLSLNRVKAFYQYYYVAHNAFIVMVGDVSVQKAKQISESLLKSMPKGKQAEPVSEAMSNKAVQKNLPFPSAQTAIIIGERGVKRSNPDFYALRVGNYILGGGGLNSILMDAIREKAGLTYGVSSQFQMLKQGGTFSIRLKTRNDQAERASDMAQRYLVDYLAKGPTASQVKAAKSYLVGSFPFLISNNSSILQYLIAYAYYGLPSDYLDNYRKNIQAVSPADIKAAFNRHINIKNLSVITVGGNNATDK